MCVLTLHTCATLYLLVTIIGSEQPLPLSRYSSILNSKGEQEVLMSKNALTHTFKRLHAPSRCRECDNFVYFNGYECEMVKHVLEYAYVHVQTHLAFLNLKLLIVFSENRYLIEIGKEP